jgi:hypothetical protein
MAKSIVDGPETLLRFGVATKTELRLTVPDYYSNLNAMAGRGSGFGDLAIGVKQQLGPTPGGFDVSATLFLSLLTGAEFVSRAGTIRDCRLPSRVGCRPNGRRAECSRCTDPLRPTGEI